MNYIIPSATTVVLYLGLVAVGLLPLSSTALLLLATVLATSLVVRFRRPALLSLLAILATLLAADVGFYAYRFAQGPSKEHIPLIEESRGKPEATRASNSVPTATGKQVRYFYSKKFFGPDPLLGRAPFSSQTIKVSKRSEDGSIIIFEDIEYAFDAKRRRTCGPPEELGRDREGSSEPQHALFFGGSYTFGMGVPCKQTLPFRFQELSENSYKSYNYGFSGYGTGQMLLQLRQASLFDDVDQPKGIAVYSFITDHFTRSVPYDVVRIADIWQWSPLFKLNEADRLIGPFRWDDDPELKSRVTQYRNAKKSSPLLQELLPRFEQKLMSPQDALEVITRLILVAKTEYEQRLEGKFYVIVWPRSGRLPNAGEWQRRMHDAGVKVIAPMPLPDGGQIHEKDGHPSKKEYNAVATELLEHIRR